MRRGAMFLGLALMLPSCGGGGSEPDPAPVSYTDPGIETFPDPGQNDPPDGSGSRHHDHGRPSGSLERGHDGEGHSEDRDPPTTGARDPKRESARGGFYRTPVTLDALVRSMERGGVIIYYDRSRLTSEDLGVLASLATQHPGDSDPIVVVPRTDKSYSIILTAWTHRLRLGAFDRSRIEGFIALFLGQGPARS